MILPSYTPEQQEFIDNLLKNPEPFSLATHAVEDDDDAINNYRNGGLEDKGSYLWLKNQITEVLKYPEYNIKFEDEKRRVVFDMPFIVASIDPDLIDVINYTFNDCVSYKMVGKHEGENELPFDVFLDDGATEENLNHNTNRTGNTVNEFADIETPEKPEITDFTSLLENNFCIGETHCDISPKRFLQDNMDTLKAEGYTTLFMEHIFYNTTMQDSLNAYNDSPIEAQMPRDIEHYLKHLGEGQSRGPGNYSPDYNFLEVVKSAKESGIRIVAIDSTLASYNDGDKNRYRDLNYLARHIIEKETPENSKWVALVGEAHISTLQGILGISELTGAPSIHIYDKNKFTMHGKKKVKQETQIEFGSAQRDTYGTFIKSDARFGCLLGESLEIEKMIPGNAVKTSSSETSQAQNTIDSCCRVS